jgi:RNA polymerase sigma-70 factor (ECF subfamily)
VRELEAMNPDDKRFDPTKLLEHATWVRHLARSLVPSDFHGADDVAQDACLAALEHRPDTARPLGAWLATVAKNLVRQKHRGETRRDARERSTARNEALPSTFDVVVQLSVHRELVDAVMDLDEPYRTTIVLRFFEELSPSAIAKRQGVPVATIKTRLARGLDRLRARLDRHYGGDGRSWLLALIPLCKPSSGAVAATTLGAVVVSTSIKVGLAAAVVAGGVYLFWPKDAPRAAESSALVVDRSDEVTRAAKHVDATDALPVETARDERAAISVASAKPDAQAPSAPAVAPWRGVVIDLQERPVAGVRVSFQPGSALVDTHELAVPAPQAALDEGETKSDAQGRFELAIEDKSGSLVVREPELATVLAGLCGAGTARGERVVVVAPRIDYAGRVVDADHRAVPGVRVEARLPNDFRTRFAHKLDNSSERGWFAISGDDGSFVLPNVARVPGLALTATREGFTRFAHAAPEFSDNSIEIVLARPGAAPGMVAGEVVDAHGNRVKGAHVALDRAVTSTDDDGIFALEIPAGGVKSPITAIARGFLPASETLSADVQNGAAGASEYVVLKLGSAALAIEGRVVDADEKPQANMKVWTGDTTFFGSVDDVPASVEGLLAGAATRSDIERLIRGSQGKQDPEDIMRETPTAFWSFVRTDAEGRFKLDGLLDREYALVVLDPATLLRVESDPIRAGRKDAVVRLPANGYHEHVAGRVVSRDGKPVAGVRVMPKQVVVVVHPSPNSTTSMDVDAKATFTDAEGRFSFAKLPKEKVFLRIEGENILPFDYGCGPQGAMQPIGSVSSRKLDDLLITVALRYHMQIELPPERMDLADAVSALDENGKSLDINVFEGNSQMSATNFPLHGGRSPVVVVSEDAKTLVFTKDGKESLRVPLALTPGQVNVVRP